jgi:hypothetical protein
MPFESPRELASVGLRPAGTGPSPLETIVNSSAQAVDSYLSEQDKKQKREKDKIDTYVSLRKAGYNQQDAYKGATSGLSRIGTIPTQDIFDTELKAKQQDLEKGAEDIKKSKLDQAKLTAETDPELLAAELATKKADALNKRMTAYESKGKGEYYRKAAKNAGAAGFDTAEEAQAQADASGMDYSIIPDKKTGRYFISYRNKKDTGSGEISTEDIDSKIQEKSGGDNWLSKIFSWGKKNNIKTVGNQKWEKKSDGKWYKVK